jgi:hypothetical protein
MKYNYQYILSVLEGYIERGEIDGTELNFLNIHKLAFDQDYKQMMEFKKRWDKLEKHFKDLGQKERL